MIQRKQTIFLFLIIALFVSMFFLNLVTLERFDVATGLWNVESTISVLDLYPLAILSTIIILLSGVTIFMYKKSSLQLRLSIINIVLIFGYIGIEIYSIVRIYSAPLVDPENFSYSLGYITAFLPVPAAVLAFMAFKGVARDIFLLRSFDRMR